MSQNVIYTEPVSPDTLIYLKHKNGNIITKKILDVYQCWAMGDYTLGMKNDKPEIRPKDNSNYQIWIKDDWTKIEYASKNNLTKKISFVYYNN